MLLSTLYSATLDKNHSIAETYYLERCTDADTGECLEQTNPLLCRQSCSFVGNLAPLLEILLTVCHSLISCYSLFYHSVSLSSRWHLYLFLFLSFFYSQHQQEYHFVRFGAKRPIYILMTYTGISGPFAYCDLVFNNRNNKKQRQER